MPTSSPDHDYAWQPVVKIPSQGVSAALGS